MASHPNSRQATTTFRAMGETFAYLFTKSSKITTQQADEALLASLGYKQEFKRAFTPLEVFGIAFSIIGLLPSIASVLFYAIPNGGGPAMVWGWAVASFFILMVGMSMAELASAAPTSGGLYFWTYSLSSPRWRRLLCWLVGYANTIGSIAAVSSIDWGCAVQIMAAASIGSNERFQGTAAQTFGVYAAVILTHIAVCCLGTTVLARLQTIYVILNILLCIAVIIALPAVTPAELRNTAKFALWDFTNFNGWPDGYAFILSFLAPLWTIVTQLPASFDSSVHISEEASNAATAVPWAIVLAIAIAGFLGWAINMSLAFCMGTDLQALYDSPQPMAQIFFNSFGRRGTLAIWAFVVLVQYMMGSSMLLAASRQTFAFSRDSALPFSTWLYRMNGYTKTPVNTVVFDGLLALILGLLAFAGDQAINAVFAISIVALYIAYAIPIAARFLGTNNFQPGPFSLGIFGLPVGAVAVLFMLFMSVVFFFPATPTTTVQDMNYTVVVLGGVMLLSVVWYYFPKYGGVYWFTGPISNIDMLSAPAKDLTTTRSYYLDFSKYFDDAVTASLRNTLSTSYHFEKMFFSRKTSPKASFISIWHDPAALPSASILQIGAAAPSSAQVHWWDSKTLRVTGASIFSPHDRLPACGFFPPSASYASFQSDDIPWATTIAPNDSIHDVSQIPSPVITSTTKLKKGRFRSMQPLKRVLTITRGVGDAIRKRRSIEKLISPADLLRGLGLALLDCSAPADREAEDDDPIDGWCIVTGITQAFDSEEDDY
ncbi:hypothetical protein D9615_008014 [Tricholomella constricta]|uniref:Amino acid transporter n=1 Tax=Tricholomella constricta TaxID=117010 RepID=A0A8H5H2E1_9AGAR|nr:hypothetical protein D9615_008014 [Tricholomella constricta]